jgi:biofilm protein TabA
MIVSDLKQMERQLPMSSPLKKAIDFLSRSDVQNLPDGRVEIDGQRVFALVQRYETIATDAPRFEYHRKFIDVQFIVTGTEIIGWVPTERMRVTEPYDADKDIAFGTVQQTQWTPVLLQAGQAAVFYPEDGHAPKLAAGTSSKVAKIVIKIAV